MSPIERVLARLKGAKRSGSGWSARCPAHEDRHASLSVNEGRDGRALICCHAGCSVESVVGALGLGVPELFPEPEKRSSKPRKSAASSRTSDWPRLRDRFRSSLTDESRERLATDLGVAPTALNALSVGQDGANFTFPEHDGAGNVVGITTRRSDGTKRCIRGSRRGLVVPSGLEGLPDPVLIVEGASDVAACLSLGRAAVGRPSCDQGAAHLVRLLKGREVLVIGERDRKEDGRWPGRDGALKVAGEIAESWGKPIQWTLPPEGAKDLRARLLQQVEQGLDLADLDACHSEGVRLLGKLQDLAEEALPEPVHETDASRWKPFPVSVLPKALRDLVTEGAASIGCDPAYLALPVIVTCAGAIGLSRAVRVKRKWIEPSVLWGSIVGESGTAKSPAQELAVEPLRALDDAARREHAKAMAEFEAEKLRYDRDLATWRKGKGSSSPPEKPQKPKCERVVAADATIEAVAHLLNDAGRGSLTIARDELAAWFKSWGEYRSATSSESSKWLELYGARALTVDRATKDPIHVSRAAVSVIGGTQPGTLRRVLTPEHLESGCAARILFAWPPRRPRRWSDRDIEEMTAQRYELVVKRLGALRPTTFTHEGGESSLAPEIVKLSPGARGRFVEYVNDLGTRAAELSGEQAAAASKLEGAAIRFALVLELAAAAEEDQAGAVVLIEEEAMAAGIVLAEWFQHEATRIYSLLAEDEEDRESRELVELIERRGGSITARELARGPRRYRGRGVAQEALEGLASAGVGRWEFSAPPTGGGHQERRLVLIAFDQEDETGDGDTRPSAQAEGGSSVAVTSSLESAEESAHPLPAPAAPPQVPRRDRSEDPPARCWSCRRGGPWRRLARGGPWVCETCHPPMPQTESLGPWERRPAAGGPDDTPGLAG